MEHLTFVTIKLEELIYKVRQRLAKREEEEKHQGRRKRGRPQLRWEDCMRRDMRRLGEDERWREGAADRKQRNDRTERMARQYFT